MLSSHEHGGIVCVINSMSECDNTGIPFPEDICSFARHTERRFKVAVIGTTNCNLQSVFADWPDINLDDHQEASHIIDRTIASNG